MKKTRQEIIEELGIQKSMILQDFNFDKASKLMKELGQTYYGSNESPSSGELLNNASNLLSSAIHSYLVRGLPSRVSSGRFIAFVHEWDSCIELELVYDPLGISKSVSKDEF